jgi:SAM-dependent methyltransferase
VGVDFSRLFLDHAEQRARDAGAAVSFVEADARRLTFEAEFDVALSLFTSWGMGDDETNQQMLDGVARALRPGGIFVLELMNRDWLLAKYWHKDWLITPQGRPVWIERSFDPVLGINTGTHYWLASDGTITHRTHHLRIYAPTELSEMLRNAGLITEKWYGGFSLEPFSVEARRLLLVAEKQ